MRRTRGTTICLAAVSAFLAACSAARAADARQVTDLSGTTWKVLSDEKAPWKDDEIFLPPVDLAKLPTNAPTGGWETLASTGVAAEVPGTAQEFLSDGMGPVSGDNQRRALGVSWWWRTFEVPAVAKGQQLRLRFASARVRAEVYIDHKLAGYNLIDGTPFDVDLTPLALSPGKHELAVRITNPGGNFAWNDGGAPIKWGKVGITDGRAFGGITGKVTLELCDAVYTDDIYVQNTPDPHAVNAIVTVHNASAEPTTRDVRFRIDGKDGTEIFREDRPRQVFPPGDTVLSVPVNLPNVPLWDPVHPNLQMFHVEQFGGGRATDAATQRFGFRWFCVDGVGKDAVFRLNGKRIVLRSAISWGLWPVTGLVPTPELAERQVRAAKAFGLNMLNFHRAVGTPIVSDEADELGLLYYEEPGGYQSAKDDAFARDYAAIKLQRMVKRDRSHPSLVIYTLINEWNENASKPEVYARQSADMAKAHEIDPSRQIVFASGWAHKAGAEEPVKLNMRPFDATQYHTGWFDSHRAGGPATWNDGNYRDPKNNACANDNLGEILFWGEENAISTPPRLDLIKAEIERTGKPGWDGNAYLAWQKAFESFIGRKGLRSTYPTVDALTTAMGTVGVGNQGRRIEVARINNVTDGYVINGWDATTIDNHSGVVDGFRYPKADPELIARYNRPLYVAVRPRGQVQQVQDGVAVDFFIVNETNVRGPHVLKWRAVGPSGAVAGEGAANVDVAGGETYGQLLSPDVKVPLSSGAGMYTVEATLVDPSGKEITAGEEQVLAVDWRTPKLSGVGAVYEWEPIVANFLGKQKDLKVTAFDDSQPRLDWLVVARPPQDEPRAVEASCLTTPDGKPGLTTKIYPDGNLRTAGKERVDAAIDFNCSEGASPDPGVQYVSEYGITWEGQLTPPVTGDYVLALEGTCGFKIRINNNTFIEDTRPTKTPRRRSKSIALTAGKPITIRVEASQKGAAGSVRLAWAPPGKSKLDPQRILDRVRNDGTTLVVLDDAQMWLDVIGKNTSLRGTDSFVVGRDWIGGQYFSKPHPLLKDLPVGQALDWPYQRVVDVTRQRVGLNIEGEELVVGAWNSWPFKLGTAVGVVPCGKGRVLLSTLSIADALDDDSGAANVARKLLCNYIEWASNH